MDSERPLFILAGNGPYENRGCEAIVRGTVRILRQQFDDPVFFCVSFFHNKEQFEKQKANEYDPAIQHVTVPIYGKYHPMRYLRYSASFLSQKLHGDILYGCMNSPLSHAKAALSIGGDNYSIDYNIIPRSFIALDEKVLAHKVPLALWGSSIGPFSALPQYEKYMSRHLNKVDMIFARESGTVNYLKSIEVINNVFSVADPAFAMDPAKPDGEKNLEIPKDAIGLNFSPLMARYVTDGDLLYWKKMVTDLILKIIKEIDCPVYLIPHVNTAHSNDFLFMSSVLSDIPKNRDVTLISDDYSAEELKWILGSMRMFCGARTHSTIAALSSCVPTISLAYSIKARGLNNDIYGHNEYCVEPTETKYIERIENLITELYADSAKVKDQLSKSIPNVCSRSYLAGDLLKNKLDANPGWSA